MGYEDLAYPDEQEDQTVRQRDCSEICLLDTAIERGVPRGRTRVCRESDLLLDDTRRVARHVQSFF